MQYYTVNNINPTALDMILIARLFFRTSEKFTLEFLETLLYI